ncbi:unnamed protein product [Adineta ricciae]|uniref:EF-hand domain-containing protein n=1 Tax=Adineta ricciae TaxID=249248 RepID=A0A815J372_ADIRI|nr:unnamed protein product [Adineta ricciae]
MMMWNDRLKDSSFILHRINFGDQITEAEYVYDEILGKGKVNQKRVHVRREVFEQIAATIKKETLPFEDFIKVVRPFLMVESALADIPEAFSLLDTDKSNSININELAVFMPAIVPNSNQYLLLRYFQPADTNNDYMLSLEEFTEFIKKGVVRDLALGRITN